MANFIAVTEEELQDLITSAQKCDGISRKESLYWDHKLTQGKEPTFLGQAEDGSALYQLQFTL